MKIILSSSNKDKIFEVQSILGDEYEILSKDECGYSDIEVIEDGKTLEENAYKKAKAIYDISGENTIADDTGLFVDALDGRPGIYAARYAGEHVTYEDNNNKLLYELRNISDKKARSAKFITCICLITKKGEVHYAKGILEGYIAFNRRGENHFGYNPIFEVGETDKTLGELTDKERLEVNHRRKALNNLKEILEVIK